MTKNELKRRITDAFQRYLGVGPPTAMRLLPTASTYGKLYEAYVLGIISKKLATEEKCTLRLSSGGNLKLKSSPGPINRDYPRIDVFKNRHLIGEIWTDVEFLTLSHRLSGGVGNLASHGHYHELDILMVEPGCSGRPRCNQVYLGVECKNTTYDKSLLRQILGVRRELSFVSDPQDTIFSLWPRPSVPAHPSSCLLVYSSHPAVGTYSDPGKTFGIDFFFEPVT